MRYKFAEIIEQIAKKDKKVVFMTGDLGFHAFEKLRDFLGERFINAGVAEHNMVTAAAGMAYAGLKPWIYSIAPFVTIKVLEEIRNDICSPNYNVKIVGLGGGFDYGIAGPTHHAINDVGLMMALPNMKIYTPGDAEDLEYMLKKIHNEQGPAYIRLSKAEKLSIEKTPYAPVRKIRAGKKITVLCLGSMVNRILPALSPFQKTNVLDVWLVSELPFALPKELLASILRSKATIVVEEHIKTGGLGHYLNHLFSEEGVRPKKFLHLHIRGYFSHRYGSRDFHLKENRLDAKNILKIIKNVLNASPLS